MDAPLGLNPRHAPLRILWLSPDEPPPQLVTHLRSRGLELCRRGEVQVLPPARLSPSIAGTQAIGKPSLSGRRVAILHPDPGSADAQAQALRAKGGEVIVLGLDPASLDRVETFDPDAVLIEPTDFLSACWEIVRALWLHPRLRWTPVVLVQAELLGLGSVTAPDTNLCCRTVQALSADYDDVVRRVARGEPFEVALETLGPARTLRALLEPGVALRARFVAPDTTIEVDVAERIIVGAREVTDGAPGDDLLGPHALAKLLSESHASVHVQAVACPAVTNVMAPLDTALHTARESLTHPPPSVVTSHLRAVQAPPVSIVGADRVNAPVVSAPVVSEPVVRAAVAKALPPVPTAAALAAPARVYAFRPNMVAPVPTTRTLPGMALPGAAELQRLHALVPPPRVAVAKEQPAGQVDPPKPGVAFLPLPVVVEPGRAVAKASEVARGGIEPFAEDDDVDAVGPVDTARYALTPRVRRRAALGLGATSLFVVALLLLWPSPDEPQPTEAPNLEAAAAAPLAKPEPAVVAEAAPVREEPLLAPPAAPNPERIPEDDTAKGADDAEARADSAEEDEEDGDEPEGRTETRRQRSRRASALVSQGHDFRHRSLFGAARARYQEALEVYPGYPRAFAGLSRVALLQKNGPEAVRHAKALVRARPAEASNQLLLGDAHHLAGDLRAARDAWRAAAKLGSSTARSRLK